MGSKVSASTVFIVSLNLIFFVLVSSQTPTPMCPQDLSPCEGETTPTLPLTPSTRCCQRFQDLSDIDTAVCLCQILKSKRSMIPSYISLNVVASIFLLNCGRNYTNYNCV
ncbi:hypothetical protein V6N13_031522 [Hibiscus sabdariffa]|uniref:Bifunctional inhibitor/plant lipid transfer protein/seed storage helical domain-containing protein n=2 Tax=Hibiscus sabdariffa TaxID=183260 RepID=A0ABR2CK45_9ROSI